MTDATGRSEVQRWDAITDYDFVGNPVYVALTKMNAGGYVTYDDYAALEVDRNQLKANYENACKMIADMHAAAMGEVCGPVLGVVEDIAALAERLKAYTDAAEHQHNVSNELRERLHAMEDYESLYHKLSDRYAAIEAERDQLKEQVEESRQRCININRETRAAIRAEEFAKSDLLAAQHYTTRLKTALEKVSSWLVCASIATPEDMAQSFPDMFDTVEAALAVCDHIPDDGSMETPAQRGGFSAEQQE